jgi:hypothetical protein
VADHRADTSPGASATAAHNESDSRSRASRRVESAHSRWLTPLRGSPRLPRSIAPIIGAVVDLILLVGLLGVMFYCAQMLLPLISPALRILIILLVAIVALYVRSVRKVTNCAQNA